ELPAVLIDRDAGIGSVRHGDPADHGTDRLDRSQPDTDLAAARTSFRTGERPVSGRRPPGIRAATPPGTCNLSDYLYSIRLRVAREKCYCGLRVREGMEAPRRGCRGGERAGRMPAIRRKSCEKAT